MSASDEPLGPAEGAAGVPSENEDRPLAAAVRGEAASSHPPPAETENPAAPENQVASPPSDQRPWRKEVGPYLMKLFERITRDGAKDNTVSLPMGQHRVLLSPQEQQLMLAFSGDPDQSGAFEGMLIDSLGLQVKVYAVLRSMEKDDDLKTEHLTRRLTRTRDFAYMLSREMTVTMRELRDSGDHKRTDTLQESRTQLQKAIVDAENVLGTELSEARPPAISSQFVYDWNEISSLPKATPLKPSTPSTGVKSPRKQPGTKDRTTQRRVILAVLGIVLIAVLLNLWFDRERQLKDFSTRDFLEIGCIEQVVNRSPTLLLVVNQSEWDQLRPDERRKAIELVGTVIKSAGYKKAEIRSRKTPSLAVWYRSGRIEVAK